MAEQRTRPARRSTASRGSREEPVRGARGAAERACEGLADLTGHRTEGVSAVRRAEEHPGRRPTARPPAAREAEPDGDGALLEYRRIRRHVRGVA
ncbi:gas vesicle protein GvpO [Streptomyces albidoflavus]|uniref:gas vesicle protein GvpO n=1 Tax=Streptomyces albidoflavus TaxID=1886 RepID=UPI0033B6FB9F